MPGPISVFDGGSYAGDAQIGHVPAGDKRLLAYAVDLDVNFIREDNSTENIRKVRIVRGLFELTSQHQNTTSYTFTSKDKGAGSDADRRTAAVLRLGVSQTGEALRDHRTACTALSCLLAAKAQAKNRGRSQQRVDSRTHWP